MFYKVVIFVVFLSVLVGTITYSRGYRLNILQNQITSSGLVAVTSNPKSAKIYIDGDFEGVTDTTVYLQPGTYSFTIIKDGYFPWKKTVAVKGEIVYSVDATLYPINSSLNPLTNIGIERSVRFGVGEQKALLFSKKRSIDEIEEATVIKDATSEKRDGLFVFDPNNRAVTIFSPLTSVAEYKVFPVELIPQNISIVFSPNYDQAILFVLLSENPDNSNNIENQNPELAPSNKYPQIYDSAFLISLNSYNDSPLDVTASAGSLIDAWAQKKSKNIDDLVSSYSKKIQLFLKESTAMIDISQDKNLIMYSATAEATLTQVLKNSLIGSNQTEDVRSTEVDSIYVYDVKEDRNYKITDQNADPNDEIGAIFFHPNSRNIVYSKEDNIVIADFDGLNRQRVYSGPFTKDFLAITNDGRLIILTNLNPSQNKVGDIYAVGIR